MGKRDRGRSCQVEETRRPEIRVHDEARFVRATTRTGPDYG